MQFYVAKCIVNISPQQNDLLKCVIKCFAILVYSTYQVFVFFITVIYVHIISNLICIITF